jgi:dGTPase
MMQWRRLLSARRLGHKAAEPVTSARSPFQKDWDRVVFCSAFRRLQDKTQVHSLPESDYVRTRLTHSLEVSSVGRSLGTMVGETIAQRHFAPGAIAAAEFGNIVAAACLAHDIGNPPFGHFGEAVIRQWFAESAQGGALLAGLGPAERADLCNFDGNAQGFRVVTRLQNWRDAGGLRLTCATLAAFTKYPHGALAASGDGAKFGFFERERELFEEVAEQTGLARDPANAGWRRHPLAYLLEAADDICYRVVDLEDGYKLGRIEFAEAETLLGELVGDWPPRYGEIADDAWRIAYLRAKAIGRLIEQAATVFLDREGDILAGAMDGALLAECPARATLQRIETLTRERIFETRERFQTEVAGAKILTTLLGALTGAFVEREAAGARPPAPGAAALMRLLPGPPPDIEPRYQWLLRVVDYVSGMTDSYALAQYRIVEGMARERSA